MRKKASVELCPEFKLMAVFNIFFLSILGLMVTFSMPKYNLWKKYLCEIAQIISQLGLANKYFYIQLATSFWQCCF